MREWHRPRIEALVEAGVDILAIETIPCRTEAEMLIDYIRQFPHIKAWVSFSCRVRSKMFKLMYLIMSNILARR